MNMTFDQLIDMAKANVDRSESFDIEFSAAYTHIAMTYSLIAIAQELKKFNDRSELGMCCLQVLSDQEREEIKNKSVQIPDEDLG